MSDKPEKPLEKPLGPQPKAERTAREAAALRENLRKRKEQARQREESRKADQ